MAGPTQTRMTFHPIINDENFSVIVGGTAQDCFDSIDDTLEDLQTNSATLDGDNVFTGTNTFAALGLRVGSSTPASASATGVAGTISWDANFLYVCTATNTWKRTALSTW